LKKVAFEIHKRSYQNKKIDGLRIMPEAVGANLGAVPHALRDAPRSVRFGALIRVLLCGTRLHESAKIAAV
jgi:hypothetical protein